MTTGSKGIALIKKWESCKLTAYLCPANKWTIGFGNTFYEDGSKVKQGDKITQARADTLFTNLVTKFERIVTKNVKLPINQNQFDALLSHTWNTGGSDTLFELVNRKAGDVYIRDWFETKYITSNGKMLKGLVSRRKEEANLYFLT
jgi:lysozyme